MAVAFKSVSEVVGKLKSLVEREFSSVFVKGEVSNFSKSYSGHIYFTISDQNSSLSVCLFKGDAMRNPATAKIKEGDEINIVGSMGLYPKRGSIQLIAKQISLDGKGLLLERFELLKKKLRSEGLFDIDQKKKIPDLPKRVAIITAPGGAAVIDFINVYRRRSVKTDLLVIPCVVQGDGAPKSIISALNKVKSLDDKNIDLIVITRGGGSLEDLWAFNDEKLARVIYDFNIPIISAIGHEVDNSISDFVADLRCETPTAAAEMITQKQFEIKSKMIGLKQSLFQFGENYQLKVHSILESASPINLIDIIKDQLMFFSNQLEKSNILKRSRELIKIDEFSYVIDDLVKRMVARVEYDQKISKLKLEEGHKLLLTLCPTNILERGYSYAEVDGKVIPDYVTFKKIKSGKEVKIYFHDGEGVTKK